MEPTFDEKDFIIVDKVSPRFSEYKRGDVVVFVPPGKEVPFIKRVIGVPGETVKIKDWEVQICSESAAGQSCEVLSQDYLPAWTTTKASCWIDEFKVTSWAYFVLWDNRDHSTDSRCCFGLSCYKDSSYLIPQDYVIGKVYVRLFPQFKTF